MQTTIKLTFSQLSEQLLILLRAVPTDQPIYPTTWICALTV